MTSFWSRLRSQFSTSEPGNSGNPLVDINNLETFRLETGTSAAPPTSSDRRRYSLVKTPASAPSPTASSPSAAYWQPLPSASTFSQTLTDNPLGTGAVVALSPTHVESFSFSKPLTKHVKSTPSMASRVTEEDWITGNLAASSSTTQALEQVALMDYPAEPTPQSGGGRRRSTTIGSNGSSINTHPGLAVDFSEQMSFGTPGNLAQVFNKSSTISAMPSGTTNKRHVASLSFGRSRTLSNLVRVDLTERQADCPMVLTEMMAGRLREHLPARWRLAKNWRLLYSMDQHGISISTLFRNTRNDEVGGAQVLAVKDSEGHVFGAFVNEPLYPHIGYYGNGECFLWRMMDFPHNESHHTSGSAPSVTSSSVSTGGGGILEVFPWTGKNNYFILCENENLAFGGGQGKFGLWIDREFENGYSARCETFDNPPLNRAEGIGEEAEFDCEHLEVWGFQF